jgi:hypothetical protein
MRTFSFESEGQRGKGLRVRARSVQLYALAVFAPFAAAVLSLLHPRDPAARNVIWIFVVYFGAVFYIAADSTSDSVRYAAWLADMHQPGYRLRDLTSAFFAEGSGYQDIYQPLISFFVSRFTDQHWLLFASFGVLFGYVYSRNIWFLIDRIPGRLTPLLVFLLFAYAFYVNIGAGLNGVRMWTALHVFVFGFLYYHATGDRRFLLVLFLTPLIHFSFWLACAVLVAFLFIKRFGLGIYGFFLISYFGVILDLGTLQTLMSYLPLPVEERASSYIMAAERNPDIMEERRGSQIWFLQMNPQFLSLFFLFTATWMVWRGVLQKTGLIRNLVVFGMLMYGVVNLLSYIPSLGRFYNLAEMLLLAALILFLAESTRQNRLDRQVFGGAALLLTINLALGLRFMLGFASIWLVVGNFFLAPFVGADQSLYELVFWVLRGMR